MNVGTLVDQNQVNHFASILHGDLLFYANRKLLTASPRQADFQESILSTLERIPESGFFLPGNRINRRKFDYIFFSIPSDGSFKAVVGIANSRATVIATLLRLRIFLLILTVFGAVSGFFGANALARNIKRSIFGMEPHEIASMLDQRTAILQSTFEGIIALDKKGCITLINKEAQRLLPSVPSIIGEPVDTFFPNLKFKDILSDGKAIYNHQQVIGESVIVYNCVPIKTKFSILGAVMTLRDLTEFQKVAAELMEVKNYTQALRAQSHEFMNKLQSVSGLIQLGRYETALTLLHEATESHQDLVSFLTNSFAQSAVSGILLGKFNRANELNIKFEIDRTSHIPQGVIVPDHELVCIVGNLIENAFESLKSSTITPKMVRVRIHPVKHCLKIIVVDNGPGISAAIKGRIFERGFTSKKGLNKGIGLSLVKQDVDNLHGKIRFRSGKQTVFNVEIPLRDGGC
jgi:sensor histidine kinase regulating citrate/malate metabolism